MKFQHFFRGIRRQAPAASPPVALPPPEKVLLPLVDAAGQVFTPVVEAGQQVALGQLVGKTEEADSGVLFATVGGKVLGVVDTHLPDGDTVKAVAIQAAQDSADAEVSAPALAGKADLAEVKPLELLARADSLGMGLTATCGPLRYITMNGVEMVRHVEFLIIKAVDQDPPVCPNQAVLAGPADDLELGVAALTHITSAQKVLIAVPAGGSSSELQEMASRNRWELCPVNAAHFPYAMDNLLILSLTGKEIPTPDGTPRAEGVVIKDIRLAMELGRVLKEGTPVTEQVVSVAGDVGRPQSFKVKLGTPLSDLVQAAGGFQGEPGKVVMGGPMLGQAQFDLSAPVTTETDGLFLQAKGNIQPTGDHPCINCGRCSDVCPVYLLPGELSRFCEFGQFEAAAENDLFHCIECGCCSYVCPAARPMVQLIRLGKSQLLAKEEAEA